MPEKLKASVAQTVISALLFHMCGGGGGGEVEGGTVSSKLQCRSKSTFNC